MKRNRIIALLVIRLILGLIFLMQGIGKVFVWGMDRVYENAFQTYEKYFPEVLLYPVAYYTSYIELIGGFLLIFGLWRDYVLYALASVLVIVSFGHGLQSPIWGVDHVLFRLILVVSLLLIPRDWDAWTADQLLKKRFRKN